MTVDRFTLTVLGQPVPQARAGRGRHGSYIPARSREYRERVQAAWMIAGRPSLGSEPFALSVMFFRSTRRTADVDNLLKGVCDALNGFAWVDERQLVCLAGVHRIECVKGEERTELTAWVASRTPAVELR